MFVINRIKSLVKIKGEEPNIEFRLDHIDWSLWISTFSVWLLVLSQHSLFQSLDL